MRKENIGGREKIIPGIIVTYAASIIFSILSSIGYHHLLWYPKVLSNFLEVTQTTSDNDEAHLV